MQSYQHIGLLLLRAREDRRLSILEVAAVLHIRPRYLHALEDGELALIPGFSYARGYLTRYADYLGLDRVEILRRFDVVTQERAAPRYFLPHSFSREQYVSPELVRYSLCAIAAILLVWFMAGRIDEGAASLVESFPSAVRMGNDEVRISAETAARVACLRPPKALYPPCIWADAPSASVNDSIMLRIAP